MDSIELVALCADDSGNTDLWTEFLRRFGPKIKTFIRGTLRSGVSGGLESSQEADLFQSTILRLVEHHCAALRRFSGTTEEEIFAYFAVIARSVVRDSRRRQATKKRFSWTKPVDIEASEVGLLEPKHDTANSMERSFLARELAQLSLQEIKNHSPEPDRDHLIFQLYFYEGLSTAQISACQGVGLSKTGVEKALSRLKERVRNLAVRMHSAEVLK
jgi:RNA polymerase sigma factor (sigma-70 family)